VSPFLGPVYKLASTIAFAVMLIFVKLIGSRVPAGEVVFYRSIIALVPVLTWVCWRGEFPNGLKTRRPWGHLVRSVVGVMAMVLWFTGIQRLPIADALAITYAAPLMTVGLAALLLGELVRRARWGAVAIGFVGVLIVLYPHIGTVGNFAEDAAALGAIAAFGSAFFMSIAQIQISRLTETERTGAIVVYFSLGSALIMLATAPFGWVRPEGEVLFYLIGCGLFGGFGQIFLTEAYRHADASVIAPLEYTSMIWATFAGWVMFSEVPSLSVLIGAAVVILSGIVVVLNEHRTFGERTE
jgi:drug/metabolite transporter (DMT)-like permease